MQKIIAGISIVIAVLCMLLMGNFDHPLWLVSLNYSLFMILWCNKREGFWESPGMCVLFFGLFLRYSLLPLSYYFFGGYHLYTPDYFDEAVVLMIYEQIVTFVIIISTCKKLSSFGETNFGESIKINKLFFISVVAVLGLIVSFSSTSLDIGYAIIASSDLGEFFEVEVEERSLGVSALMVVWTLSLFVLYVCIILFLKSIYQKKNNEVYVLLCIFFTLVLGFLTFINQSGAGMARWQTIVYTLSGFFLITKVFKSRRKLVFRLLIAPLFAGVLFITAIKNGGMSDTGPNFLQAMEHTLGPESMDAYLNGPDGISGSIKLKNESGLGISSLIHDIIHPIPIIHRYENVNLETNLRYNKMVGKLGFIIPLQGQSMIYFGYLFAPLLTILIILLVRHFDKKYKQAHNFMIYFYGFCAIWFAMSMIFTDFTILSAWFFSPILPLYFIFAVFNKSRNKIRHKDYIQKICVN